MSATPSLANIILGVIAAGIFVARLFATHVFVPATEPAKVPPIASSFRSEESSHTHKADRMPLFRSAGPSVTTTTPVTLRGAADSDNTTVVAKNVVIHPTEAAGSFDNTPLAQAPQPVNVFVTGPPGRQADRQDRDRRQHHIADRRVARTSE